MALPVWNRFRHLTPFLAFCKMLSPIPGKDSRVGFWGTPTATIDWCERNYEVTFYIAEFWNTLTNLLIILTAIFGIYQTHKHQGEKRIILCYILQLVVGCGSWLFHMTLMYEMQLLDEIPMIFGAAANAYVVYQIREPRGKVNYMVSLFLIAYCIAVVAVYVVVQVPMFHQAMFLVLVFSVIFMDYQLASFVKSIYRIGVTACFLFLLGGILWMCEKHPSICAGLDRLRMSASAANSAPGASLLAPLTQLHAWWHLMSGYASYMHVVLISQGRQMLMERERDSGLLPAFQQYK